MTLTKGVSKMSGLVLGMEDDEVIQTPLLRTCNSGPGAGMSDRDQHDNVIAVGNVGESTQFVATGVRESPVEHARRETNCVPSPNQTHGEQTAVHPPLITLIRSDKHRPPSSHHAQGWDRVCKCRGPILDSQNLINVGTFPKYVNSKCLAIANRGGVARKCHAVKQFIQGRDFVEIEVADAVAGVEEEVSCALIKSSGVMIKNWSNDVINLSARIPTIKCCQSFLG